MTLGGPGARVTDTKYVGRFECNKQIESCRLEHARMIERLDEVEQHNEQTKESLSDLKITLRDIRVLVLLFVFIAMPQTVRAAMDLWKVFH